MESKVVLVESSLVVFSSDYGDYLAGDGVGGEGEGNVMGGGEGKARGSVGDVGDVAASAGGGDNGERACGEVGGDLNVSGWHGVSIGEVEEIDRARAYAEGRGLVLAGEGGGEEHGQLSVGRAKQNLDGCLLASENHEGRGVARGVNGGTFVIGGAKTCGGSCGEGVVALSVDGVGASIYDGFIAVDY